MKAQLTEDQRKAVLAYAAEKGGRWKARLREDWTRADARIGGESSPELQQVRNQLGPMWLNRTTLQQVKES